MKVTLTDFIPNLKDFKLSSNNSKKKDSHFIKKYVIYYLESYLRG